MSAELRVNEIFLSIDGEGKRAGELTAFLRLTGCNLRCSYCDTEYAFTEGRLMSISDILSQISGVHNITLTGGEPLQQDISELLDTLREHDVNIETNGSMDIEEVLRYPHVFLTIDYKCPTSGMEHAMLERNFRLLRPKDVLKFVVSNRQDLEKAEEICDLFRPPCPVYISPVFDAIEPADIVDYMKEKNRQDWRLQLQLHKIIWDPRKRGV